jgi:hypothetical protein
MSQCKVLDECHHYRTIALEGGNRSYPKQLVNVGEDAVAHVEREVAGGFVNSKPNGGWRR